MVKEPNMAEAVTQARAESEVVAVSQLINSSPEGPVRAALGEVSPRSLSQEEIEQLEANGNVAEDWSSVLVAPGTCMDRIRSSSFFGRVVMGPFTGSVDLGGIELPTGVYGSTVADSCIGGDALVHMCWCVYELGRSLASLQQSACAVLEGDHRLRCAGAWVCAIDVVIARGGAEYGGHRGVPVEGEHQVQHVDALSRHGQHAGGVDAAHLPDRPALDISQELYLAMIIDRERETPVIIASTEGGMEIEEVAASNPELIHKIYIHPVTGISGFHVRQLAFKLGLNKAQQKPFFKLVTNLYRLFVSKDASLVEINPLIITAQDDVIALDGKINIDDNGVYRHPDIQEMRDIHEEEPLEYEASKYDLNYIKLDGDIGCMVNGAGLAMATMDILKYYGGEPANFLDVGGGTSEDRVKEAFNILLSDKNVKTVFVNIFGGIVRTDLVANGIVQALQGVDISNTPIVVRLVGTNQEEGRRILNESGLNFKSINDLPVAAKTAVELSGGV